MELRDYLRILHKNWWIIVITTLLGVASAAGVSIAETPKYQATAKLYVSVNTDTQTTGDLVQGSNFARQNMASFVELTKTESVLKPVAEKLGIEAGWRSFAGKVQASAPVNSTLLNISVTDTDPVLAAKAANELGERLRVLVQEELEPPRGEDKVSAVHLKIVQSAEVPENPVSPRVKVNLALGLLVGLALGVGIAVLRATLDTRVHSTTDIEQVTDVPILGTILEDPNAKLKPLIVHNDPKSPRAESFRALRTNMQFLSVGEGSRAFVISSAAPSEGKSTTAANLALALAELGLKVALVDCDLRKPKVATNMGIEGAVGLTDVLIGKLDLPEVLQRWGRTHLYVLPAGKVPPNPSELLGSSQMDELLLTLREHVDFVILDAPPLLLVTDAAVIGKKTQGVILAAASGKTRKPQLAAAVKTLETAGVGFRGVVVTMVPMKGPDSYGYGNYGYGAYSELGKAKRKKLFRSRAEV